MGIKQGSDCCLLHGSFFIRLLISSEDRGEVFLRKFCRISTYYTTLRPGIQNSSLCIQFAIEQIGEALSLQTCIRQLLGLDLCRDNDYLHRGFLVFCYSVHKLMEQDSIWSRPLPFKFFPIVLSLIISIFDPVLQRCIQRR